MRDGKIEDNGEEARSRTELLDAKARIRTLERQLKQLRDENVILKKAERFFPEKSLSVPVHSRAPGPVFRGHLVPEVGGLTRWLLCLAGAAGQSTVHG